MGLGRVGEALACALALTACGGAAPSVAPAKQPAENVDALAADLENAERDLQANLGPAPGAKAPEPMPSGAPGNAAPGPMTGGEPAPPAQPAPPTNQPAPAPPPPDAAATASPCVTACRALASMHRSADRICELAGSDSERCGWAREKVRAADRRVEGAGCHC